MAEWITVFVLLAFGMALVLLEVIFIPGTTVIGIIGMAALSYAIYLGYNYFGAITGTYILSFSLVAVVLGLYYSFRSGVWERFALKRTIDERVNEGETLPQIGDSGLSVSAIRPMGEVDFEDIRHEVHSFDGNWIDAGKKVRVAALEGKKVFVEALGK